MQNVVQGEQPPQQAGSFACQAIEEQDPSLAGGYRVLFDRNIPFHMRYEDKNVVTQDLPSAEVIRVRVFVVGNERTPQAVKIELSNDSDLFFHYSHVASENNIQQIRNQQKLQIDLSDYPGITIKSLNRCDSEQSQFSAIFTILAEGDAHLEIVQTTEYKTIEVISYTFQPSPEDLTRRIADYRYRIAKQKLSNTEGRLHDLNEIIRLKNPSLLVMIQKSMSPQQQQQQQQKGKK